MFCIKYGGINKRSGLNIYQTGSVFLLRKKYLLNERIYLSLTDIKFKLQLTKQIYYRKTYLTNLFVWILTHYKNKKNDI